MPVAEASLRNAYISLSDLYAVDSIAFTLSTPGDSGTFSTSRGRTGSSRRVRRNPVVGDRQFEASTDDAVDAHDGGRREGLAIGATSFEV